MEKAKKASVDEKIRIISLSDLGALLDVAAKAKYIKEDEKELVRDWVSDAAGGERKRI